MPDIGGFRNTRTVRGDRNVAVVTHATPVKSAVAWLLGGAAEMIMRLRVSLASITAFGPVAHGLVLTDFNWCPARHIG